MLKFFLKIKKFTNNCCKCAHTHTTPPKDIRSGNNKKKMNINNWCQCLEELVFGTELPIPPLRPIQQDRIERGLGTCRY